MKTEKESLDLLEDAFADALNSAKLNSKNGMNLARFLAEKFHRRWYMLRMTYEIVRTWIESEDKETLCAYCGVLVKKVDIENHIEHCPKHPLKIAMDKLSAVDRVIGDILEIKVSEEVYSMLKEIQATVRKQEGDEEFG